MGNTVNSRVLLLKKELGLSNMEFCSKAGISTATLWNIQNEVELKPKTLRTLCEALNANKEWVMTGKGKMFLDKAETPATPEKSLSAKALELLEEQLKKKDEQIASLLAVISKLNFPKALENAAVPFMFPNINGTVSGARALNT